MDSLSDYNYDYFKVQDFLSLADIQREKVNQEVYSLSDCAASIIIQKDKLTHKALEELPSSVTPLLLLSSLKQGRYVGNDREKKYKLPTSAYHIYKRWPWDIFRFKDLLPPNSHPSKESNSFYKIVKGVGILALGSLFSRPNSHNVKLLDLTGFPLDQNHVRDMFSVYPFILLQECEKAFPVISSWLKTSCEFMEMNKAVQDKLLKHASYKAKEWESWKFSQLQEHLCNKSESSVPGVHIHIDRLELIVHTISNSAFFMDIALGRCLKEHTPITLSASNVVIRGSVFTSQFYHPSYYKTSVGEEALETVKTLPKDAVEGVFLQWLPPTLLLKSADIFSQFPSVKRLCIWESMVIVEQSDHQGASLYQNIGSMIQSYVQLSRLEFHSLKLTHCLGKLLGAVKSNLDFLSLESCILTDEDLIQLATSPVLDRVKELNLRDICRYLYNTSYESFQPLRSENGDLPPTDSALLEVVRAVSTKQAIKVLNLSKNLFRENAYSELCDILMSFTSLKCLLVHDVMTSFDLCVRLLQGCIGLPSLQGVVVSCKEIYVGIQSRHSSDKIRDKLLAIAQDLKHSNNRNDLEVCAPLGYNYDIFASQIQPEEID